MKTPSPAEKLRLTPRQLEVLKRVHLGEMDKAIADHLHMSIGTVRAHLKAIYQRLGVPGRVGAALAFERARHTQE